MEFRMKDGGFYTELPFGRLEVSGDEEHGFRPFQLMVASIAVCSGGVLRKILEKQRIEVSDIHIQTDVERDEANANRIEKVHVHFRITGENLNADKIEKALVLTRKNCAMVQSVEGSITVEETFEIVAA